MSGSWKWTALFWRRNNRCCLLVSSRTARCYHTRARLITKWSHPTLTHPWVWNRIRGVSTMSARLLLGAHWIINLYTNYTLTYMTIRVQNAISESHLERTLQSFSPKKHRQSLTFGKRSKWTKCCSANDIYYPSISLVIYHQFHRRQLQSSVNCFRYSCCDKATTYRPSLRRCKFFNSRLEVFTFG